MGLLLKLNRYENITPIIVKRIFTATTYSALLYGGDILPWTRIKQLKNQRNKVELLRGKISRAMLKFPICSFNEATNADLDWLTYDHEADKIFINYYLKLVEKARWNPSSINAILLEKCRSKELPYFKFARDLLAEYGLDETSTKKSVKEQVRLKSHYSFHERMTNLVTKTSDHYRSQFVGGQFVQQNYTRLNSMELGAVQSILLIRNHLYFE